MSVSLQQLNSSRDTSDMVCWLTVLFSFIFLIGNKLYIILLADFPIKLEQNIVAFSSLKSELNIEMFVI